MAWIRRGLGAPRRLNPYFQAQQRRRVTRVAAIRIVVVVIFCAGLFWALLYSSLMRIKVVEVSGASAETTPSMTANLEQLLDGYHWLVLPKNHRWFFGHGRIERQLLEAFPLNAIAINQSGGFLRVTVEEKTRTFYLVQNDRMYALDRMGFVLQELEDVERARVMVESERGASFPILYDERGGGAQEIPPAWLESLVLMFDAISARTMLTPRTLTLSNEQGRVDVTTDAGVMLYLTLQRSVDQQLSKLEALLEQDAVDLSALTYIDLRFTHRVFYH